MSKEIIDSFYSAFKNHDGKKMAELYHANAVFNDPAFTNLNCQEAGAMWNMLLERSGGDLSIEYHSVIADEDMGQCTWEAKYKFSKTGNDVHNIIHASMKFKDGKIIKHTDDFNFWRWSSMALGTPGKILGWTPFLKKKVQKMAMGSLKSYMK